MPRPVPPATGDELLRSVLRDAVEYAIFTLDLQRRVTSWNVGARLLLGYEEGEMLGRPADIIFTEEDRAARAPELEIETALREGRAGDNRFHRRKDGSRFWASGSLMVVRDGTSDVVGFLKILRDQTSEHEIHLELERHRAELQAADAAKDSFLATLSHELRNPLASIDGAAAVLLSDGVSERDRLPAAHIIRRQAKAMRVLLDDLLDVTRLKLGRLQVRKEAVALDAVIAAAVETTRPLVEAAGHRLTVDVRGAIEIDADPVRLAQVISNLLTNAVKFTPPGGRLHVKAERSGDMAEIAVQDSGVGMDASQLASIFELYSQVNPTQDGSAGLGIGLALVRSLVDLHGGTVRAFSEGPGRGSEITVRLPGARASAGTAGTPAPAVSTAPVAGVRRRGLVLIADDNLDAAWGVARLLELAGFTTLRVAGGIPAVAAVAEHRPDAGVIDIGMPDLDGNAVARQVRATEWGRRMVLVAATGRGHEQDARAALAAGFDAHLTKPVDVRKLAALLDELRARGRG